MHLTSDGTVRRDVDFVIEGTDNIPVLREHLPAIRSKLRFTEVTNARQGHQYERYRRTITVRGSRRDLPGHDVIRISSFTSRSPTPTPSSASQSSSTTPA